MLEKALIALYTYPSWFLGGMLPGACTRMNKYLRPLIRMYRLHKAYESQRSMEDRGLEEGPPKMINLILPSADAESAWSAVGRGTSVLVMSSTTLLKHPPLDSLARHRELHSISILLEGDNVAVLTATNRQSSQQARSLDLGSTLNPTRVLCMCALLSSLGTH